MYGPKERNNDYVNCWLSQCLGSFCSKDGESERKEGSWQWSLFSIFFRDVFLLFQWFSDGWVTSEPERHETECWGNWKIRKKTSWKKWRLEEKGNQIERQGNDMRSEKKNARKKNAWKKQNWGRKWETKDFIWLQRTFLWLSFETMRLWLKWCKDGNEEILSMNKMDKMSLFNSSSILTTSRPFLPNPLMIGETGRKRNGKKEEQKERETRIKRNGNFRGRFI